MGMYEQKCLQAIRVRGSFEAAGNTGGGQAGLWIGGQELMHRQTVIKADL